MVDGTFWQFELVVDACEEACVLLFVGGVAVVDKAVKADGLTQLGYLRGPEDFASIVWAAFFFLSTSLSDLRYGLRFHSVADV